MYQIPNDLRRAVAENRLIIFVGAGLSYQLTNNKNQKILGWSNLVEKIIGHLSENGYDSEYLLPVVKKHSPIEVLGLLESNSEFPKKEIHSFLKDFFELDDEKNDYKIHKKICSLSNKIITTNYDTAFERVEPSLRKCKAYKGKNYELTTHREPNARLLFKLHGCYEDSDSMILFPSKYKELYENNNKDAEHSLLVLRNIIYNNSLLFIGTGMGEFQVNNIFKEIKRLQAECNQKHFIITNKTLDSALDFITPILIEDYSEIETIIDELLKIKDNIIDPDKEEIKKLKDDLDNAQKRIEELEMKEADTSESDKDALLEREALKYFSRGLNYHIEGKIEKAIEQYETCVELKSNFHEAFFNWGSALSDQAKNKSGKEADRLFEEAYQKFEKAIIIKPDMHEVFNNWGSALSDQAKNKSGKEADQLFTEAYQKYEEAIKIKPDKHDAFFNWGNALYDQAENKSGEEADQLLAEAYQKFKEAIKIKPDKHEAFLNWGNALSDQAENKSGKEADQLFAEAYQKYEKAINIKPDKHEAFNNWGSALSDQAKNKSGEEADRLFEEAYQKFEKAIMIKLDMHEAFFNWGSALSDQAKNKSGKEADQLFAEAYLKFEKAIKIKPDMHEAFLNWGSALSHQAENKSRKEVDKLLAKAYQKFEKTIMIKPDEHEAFFNWGTVLMKQAKGKSGEEADQLFAKAYQKFEKAISIKPDKHEAFNNWGNALYDQAKTKSGKEADRLFAEAHEKLEKAIFLGGGSYNLACLKAIQGNKEEAFVLLEKSLSKHEISPDFVSHDEDWTDFWQNKNFKAIIQKYKDQELKD